MNRRLVFAVSTFLLLPLVALPCAGAYPTTSPSAVAAANLKARPPRGWIRHYLGDDRYKIVGGIWKLVTTPNDTTSYPAWAPEMLGRPAANVIGFSSVDDAIEAGYPPSGRYGASFPDYVGIGKASPDMGGAPSAPGGMSGGNRRASRITLADGASSAILPAGWRHIATAQNIGPAGPASVSVMTSPRGNTLIFAFVTIPANSQAQVEGLLNPRNSVDAMVNNNVQRSANASIRRTTLGGLRAVMLTRRSQVPGSILRGGELFPMTLASRGNKAYLVLLGKAGRGPEANTIMRSFRAG